MACGLDRLAACEPGFQGVPVLDGGLAKPVAKVDHTPIATGTEIDEAGGGVFDFYTPGIEPRRLGALVNTVAEDRGSIAAPHGGSVRS